jgi:translation initiation factor 2 subunit 2
MSDSSDSEDYIPFGFSMLSINSKTPVMAVMAQKSQEEISELPTALQYLNLLTRAMELLNRNKEDEGEKMKLDLSVVRKSRKTYINVVTIANQLNRQPEHVSHFISKFLLSEGTINKEGQLILSGSFLQSAVEKALRQFIEIYVVCKSCESVEDTFICKENKLYFLKCEKCKASRCVGNTVEGFTSKETGTSKLRGLI